jgi:hypothetical protein
MIVSSRTRALLETPIGELPFSSDFITLSNQMSIGTIADIIQTKEKEILNHSSFTHEWLLELIRFMRQHGIVNLLEDPSRF